MCYDEWELIEASPTVIDWIKNGVELPFQNEQLPIEYRNRHFNKKEQSFLQSDRNFVSPGYLLNRMMECDPK